MIAHVKEFACRCRVAAEVCHLIVVVGDIESEVDTDIFATACRKDLAVKLEFDTGICHFGTVDGLGGPAGCRVKFGGGQNIGTVFAVEVEGTCETIAKECEVDAGIPCSRLLPAKLIVRGSV